MSDQTKRRWPAFAGGVVTALVALAAIGFIAIFSGGYNVAATVPHTAPVAWAVHTTMERSVASRASGLTPPASFSAADLAEGGSHYRGMCQQCHGGPGVKRAEWAEGMNPSPPDLTKAAGEWTPAEIYWILKHGIKMSAMPSFGSTHSDADLWKLAGFVKRLPTISPQAYAAIEPEQEEGEEGHHHAHAH